mmetsp:Transcript_7006/g.13515  ORF Transcript_7006/g.13515 Transcript_7006/m.13515 type:complete len:244 (-) Transcript_7006:271-1002(-)
MPSGYPGIGGPCLYIPSGIGPSIADSVGLRLGEPCWAMKFGFMTGTTSLPSLMSGRCAGGPFRPCFMFWNRKGEFCLAWFSRCRTLPSRIARFFSSSRRFSSAIATCCCISAILRDSFPTCIPPLCCCCITPLCCCCWRSSPTRRSITLRALSASSRFISSTCFSCLSPKICFSSSSSLRFSGLDAPPTVGEEATEGVWGAPPCEEREEEAACLVSSSSACFLSRSAASSLARRRSISRDCIS